MVWKLLSEAPLEFIADLTGAQMYSSLKKLGFLIAALTSAVALQANAVVMQTTGSGSAVTSIDAAANFENQDALNSPLYTEDGLSFSRTNLTYNNNSCGYGGCLYAFPNFNENYMYGVGTGGYFSIMAEAGQLFQGLEFVAGSGFGGSSPLNFVWEALLGNNVVDSGSGSIAAGSILGFTDVLGFDTLRWTETYNGAANFTYSYNAPAFDTVRAQYVSASAQVPEPATLGLLGLGLLGFAAARRKAANGKKTS